jgi:hypothetical protein
MSPLRHYLVVAVAFSRGRRGDRLALVYVLGPMAGRVKPVDVTNAMARQVVWVAKVNECDIVRGKWPTVGRVAGFKSQAWPLPPFFLVDKEVEYYRRVQLSNSLDYKLVRRVAEADIQPDRELCAYGAGAFKTELLWRHQQRSFPRYPDLMSLLD